tara:strand:+ start:115 stop:240 length:126 start_codon:yes stop_codon:yes gene_type:complete
VLIPIREINLERDQEDIRKEEINMKKEWVNIEEKEEREENE